MQDCFDYFAVPSPCYVVDERLLVKNLECLKHVSDMTGCRILLAQKAFSMYSMYPLIGKYLNGTTASSICEARLGRDEMGGETHIFSPAYNPAEFDEIAGICDHVVFNSFEQYARFKGRLGKCGAGIRVNPEYSEQDTEIYDPCAKFSRLGVTLENFKPDELDGISGLHFHTMCEQNSDTLSRTLDVFEDKFGEYLGGMKWVNFGGGHHITRDDYDIQRLIESINRIQNKYGVRVYLEPGEAVALNAGFLVSTVLDVLENGMDIAILDTSSACHMPDVLEMPYRPRIFDAKTGEMLGNPGEREFTYRFGGNTCLAGDITGDYSVSRRLSPGDRLVFCDMAIYTMVKNNTFNGVMLPSIVAVGQDGELRVVREFGYEDFKARL